MFTGIIEELGQVVGFDRGAESASLTVRAELVTADAVPGASIAVNGVCLTTVAATDSAFSADVMRETLQRSSLGALGVGSLVNLERAVRVSDRLSGHIVQGHVDGVGTVIERVAGDRWEVVRMSCPDPLARYVVEKGSIAVDGVSLTVSGVGDGWFEVSLIPTTLAMTTLGRRQVGDEVNLEADVVAKYVERLLAGQVRA
ncbi:MAG TPA: riboflavin synthase [Jiangellaceae bacterium]|jgi:riboflavin synthase|nr:riboflavin synthase [Jiangellaceae bacterium]